MVMETHATHQLYRLQTKCLQAAKDWCTTRRLAPACCAATENNELPNMGTWREVENLEKVLLDPIFMILKCDFFTRFGSCFLKLHDVSTSHLEALVT